MATVEQGTDVAETTSPAAPFYSLEATAVLAAFDSDDVSGLSSAEAAARLTRYGPNQITSEKPPSAWAIALQQLRDPMNIMLVAVAVVSLAIGEVSTAILVALLVVLNVVLGTRQELQAQASVDALSKMQVPQTRVVRSTSCPATSCRWRQATSCRPTVGSSGRRRSRPKRRR